MPFVDTERHETGSVHLTTAQDTTARERLMEIAERRSRLHLLDPAERAAEIKKLDALYAFWTGSPKFKRISLPKNIRELNYGTKSPWNRR